jgi:SAM-dependent methyltransferase
MSGGNVSDMSGGNVSGMSGGNVSGISGVDGMGSCNDKPILLDLGCGTGQLSIRFAKAGFDVIGCDISEECLSIAAEKAFEENYGGAAEYTTDYENLPDGAAEYTSDFENLPDSAPPLDIRFVKQDIRKLDMYGTVMVTVSSFDVINHLRTVRDIKACFERVALFTEPGGLFLMDYNTPFFHREVLASNTFNFDAEDLFVSREYEFKGGNETGVSIAVNIFEKDGKNYRRSVEHLYETAFETEIIKNLLEQVGFSVTVTDFYDGGEPHKNSKRLLFSAKKA